MRDAGSPIPTAAVCSPEFPIRVRATHGGKLIAEASELNAHVRKGEKGSLVVQRVKGGGHRQASRQNGFRKVAVAIDVKDARAAIGTGRLNAVVETVIDVGSCIAVRVLYCEGQIKRTIGRGGGDLEDHRKLMLRRRRGSCRSSREPLARSATSPEKSSVVRGICCTQRRLPAVFCSSKTHFTPF